MQSECVTLQNYAPLEFTKLLQIPKGRKLQRYFKFLIRQYLIYAPCQYFALFTFRLVLGH